MDFTHATFLKTFFRLINVFNWNRLLLQGKRSIRYLRNKILYYIINSGIARKQITACHCTTTNILIYYTT